MCKEFVTVYKPIAGWKAVHMTWDEECGCVTPQQTGMFGYKTRAEAVDEARAWARDMDVPFKP